MTARTPKIVVVGGIYVDMAMRCNTIPTPGQDICGTGFSYAGTGPGLNQAAQASLCGCEVHLIAKVGVCPFAPVIRGILDHFCIASEFVYTAKAMNTGAVFTIVDAEGENTSLTCEGANSALTCDEVETAEEIIGNADVCLVHGRLPKDVVIKAIMTAKLRGTRVILDPAGAISPDELQEHQPLPAEFFTADILIPNLYEASLITDRSSANIRTAKMMASDIIARGAEAAVITMGKRGCMVVDRNVADHILAPVIELVDSTATGDAFAGALAASCAVGDDLRTAVKFASAAGALACTKFGSVEALPHKAEIIQLLQQQGD